MGRKLTKQCNKCGFAGFYKKYAQCPLCSGTMCTVITKVSGNLVTGVLCRDKVPKYADGIEIIFLPHRDTLDDAYLNTLGLWYTEGCISEVWSAKEWKEQYGKLPRKGSKELVMLEL